MVKENSGVDTCEEEIWKNFKTGQWNMIVLHQDD